MVGETSRNQGQQREIKTPQHSYFNIKLPQNISQPLVQNVRDKAFVTHIPYSRYVHYEVRIPKGMNQDYQRGILDANCTFKVCQGLCYQQQTWFRRGKWDTTDNVQGTYFKFEKLPRQLSWMNKVLYVNLDINYEKLNVWICAANSSIGPKYHEILMFVSNKTPNNAVT